MGLCKKLPGPFDGAVPRCDGASRRLLLLSLLPSPQAQGSCVKKRLRAGMVPIEAYSRSLQPCIRGTLVSRNGGTRTTTQCHTLPLGLCCCRAQTRNISQARGSRPSEKSTSPCKVNSNPRRMPEDGQPLTYDEIKLS